MKQRLVITGMGAVTPIGIGVADYWRNLLQGACGIAEISRFDASGLPVRIAAEIRDFDPAASLPRNMLRNTSAFMQFACAAGEEALEMAGFTSAADRQRVGVCMGTAMAGMAEIAASGADFLASSSGKISPHLVPKSIGNMACAHMAINHQLHGPGFTLNTACSAGGDAIMAAAMLIGCGEADAMLVLGGESILSPSIVSSLAQARALSRRNDQPSLASRPFDLERDGFVIGEGGGAIMLESEARALARGANILAILAGWGSSLDGHHITAPDPAGDGATTCMERALRRAGLMPADIDYVNAHGTSTQLGDKAETLALKRVFGTATPPVSSTKGSTGHLMGAGGLTELIACIEAVRHGMLPPTINLHNPDPECDLDYVPNVARKASIKTAMSNSLGFGGQNSSIIVQAYEREGI